jgi:hypothetical protein
MGNTLLSVLTGGLLTLVGAWLTHKYYLKRDKLRAERWYAEYFLNKKFETLNNLYVALVDCHRALNRYGNLPPSNRETFDKQVSEKLDDFEHAMALAHIFLNDHQYKIMSKIRGAFRQAAQATWLSLPDEELPDVKKDSYPPEKRNVNWTTLQDACDKALMCLRDVLNPIVLGKIEKEFKQ